MSLDDLLPRTDISGRITPSLVAMLTRCGAGIQGS